MNFNITRESLLPALQMVSGVVDRRQTLPILSNVLIKVDNESLTITATDMEVELVAVVKEKLGVKGETTLPARKLLDICRTLPQGASLSVEVKNDRTLIRSGKSRFTLSNLPAQEFPTIDISNPEIKFKIKNQDLRGLIENTQFAMAQQDVRYYLNGLLLEIGPDSLRAVATDGHRLALDEKLIPTEAEGSRQIIVPRKGVMEFSRLLHDGEEEIEVKISANHIHVEFDEVRFTSKLIDGKFPDYQRVIPETVNSKLLADREALKQSLTRASILSNEKYKGVRIMLNTDKLRALAHNPEQEEAEEEIEVQYQGDEIEIGFNVSYLLDALSVIRTNKVIISVADPNSSCLILPDDDSRCKYVVMPMRL